LTVAPLIFLLTVVLLGLSPLVLLAAFIADLFLPGSWRSVRLALFAIGYLFLELSGFIALFALWIASGFGATIRGPSMQNAHYGFMGWWLSRMEKLVRRVFRLRIYIEDRPTPRPGPILVFSRHAGPGNSLLLIGTILVGYRRHPRIVMLAKLQWEPLFDIMLNRVPNRFIKHDPNRRDVYIEAIRDLASGLGDMDAFVLFPEGKDFTPKVRTRAIEYLRGKGHDEAAERAEKMAYMLPPRHNGVMAAIQSAQNADIVFVAHSVFEDIGTFRELWWRVPFEKPIRAKYWRIPPSEVPRDKDQLIDWLYQWWERIDGWVAEKAEI
ncbi:MAG: hypothetical protein ACRD1T_05575, partial [Acidimicrobiia bacterium]